MNVRATAIPSLPRATPVARGRPLAAGFRALEHGFDRFFGVAANPLRQLGALGFHLFWVIVVTGFYAYAYFDTSLAGAWRSVEALTREQWYLGGVMRSLHRYAADGFVVVMCAHLIREFAYGRFTGFRWYSWLTGVPLLWLALASGIVGYWLVWDELAQFIGVAMTELFAWLPGFDAGMVRNFLVEDTLSDRLFSLLVFLHIGVPLFLLLGLWIHIQRLAGAVTRPDRRLGWATLGMLLALSLAAPAVSQAPADLARVPQLLGIDWFYLFPYPLLYRWSAAEVWLLLGALTLLLAALPWLWPAAKAPAAVVDTRYCSGCGYCVADCPYGAVVMVSPAAGRAGERQARVQEDLCAGCGICTGACPSSSPFRSVDTLLTGIDMPQLPIDALRQRLLAALAVLHQAAGVVVFACGRGAVAAGLRGADTAVLELPCIAMLPPGFIDFALRNGAAGVLAAACADGDCEFRFGARWMEERITGAREPHLRASVPAARVRLARCADAGALAGELAALRAALPGHGGGAGAGPVARTGTGTA
ncbi:MAG: cytochrome b N-terminal domain-containing protein [Betaproteobacteria bacterium]|nr:cytochrome b N-terminal domain-containing protein [Betaproteobacteria bacterium]